MAVRSIILLEPNRQPYATHYIVDTLAERPSTGLSPDDTCVVIADNANYFYCNGAWQTAPAASVTDPNPQSYTPGSFIVATGKYVILSVLHVSCGLFHD